MVYQILEIVKSERHILFPLIANVWLPWSTNNDYTKEICLYLFRCRER